MFYKHAKLLKELRDSGTRARAELLEVHLTGSGSTTSTDVDDNRSAWWDYKLEARVMPEGEEPFEATIKTRWYPSAGGLHRGVVVEVLYDPNDHDKIVIDYAAALRDAEARIDQQRSGWSARGLVETPTGLESASGEPLSTPDLGASVARLNEATELLRAKLAPRGVTPGAPPSQDPVDRLVKLADLRNRGVLTDAEFEAEKKKILES